MKLSEKQRTLDFIAKRLPMLSPSELRTLTLADRGLRRWADLECGMCYPIGGGWLDVIIERDEETGRPVRKSRDSSSDWYAEPIRDMEASYLRKIAAVCAKHGLHYYKKPSGYVYLSLSPLNEDNYIAEGVSIAL